MRRPMPGSGEGRFELAVCARAGNRVAAVPALFPYARVGGGAHSGRGSGDRRAQSQELLGLVLHRRLHAPARALHGEDGADRDSSREAARAPWRLPNAPRPGRRRRARDREDDPAPGQPARVVPRGNASARPGPARPPAPRRRAARVRDRRASGPLRDHRDREDLPRRPPGAAPRAGGVLGADPGLRPGGHARRSGHADLGHPVARGGGRIPPPASPPDADSSGPGGAGTRRRAAAPAQTAAGCCSGANGGGEGAGSPEVAHGFGSQHRTYAPPRPWPPQRRPSARPARGLGSQKGAEDRIEIRIAEVISDVTHDMGGAAALEKEGIERELQELLADAPPEGLRLMRREWPTDIGPVDLMCRDENDGFVAVEIKRVGTIDAVEQLTRYLERICEEPGLDRCRGVLAAQTIKPQARRLAESRGIACVEVDPSVLRGERDPDLTLFAA